MPQRENTAVEEILNDAISIGNEGISKTALKNDIQMLITAYQRKKTYEFPPFREVWDQLNFSFIHFGCPMRDGRTNFMNALYEIAQDYFSKTRYLEFKVASLYTLYLLYYTQPELWERVGIPVTPDMMKMMWDIYVYCENYSLLDFVYVFWKLREDGAFLLCAADKKIEVPISQCPRIADRYDLSKLKRTDNMHGLPQILGDASRSSLSQFSSDYASCKRRLVEVAVGNERVRDVAEGVRMGDTFMDDLADFTERWKKSRLSSLRGEVNTVAPIAAYVESRSRSEETEPVVEGRASTPARGKTVPASAPEAACEVVAAKTRPNIVRAATEDVDSLIQRRMQLRNTSWANRRFEPEMNRVLQRRREIEERAREFSLNTAPSILRTEESPEIKVTTPSSQMPKHLILPRTTSSQNVSESNPSSAERETSEG
ncbi:uncharacterized protein VTP21DRAFT_11527 [Calcarisporiella thermophila]|uniref:uncharacterized protein n=1 Tax=Calcarisporiella thermophila TaxID=911321 RepID=UPI00374432D1